MRGGGGKKKERKKRKAMEPMVKRALPKLISLDWARKKRETFRGFPGEPAPPSCEQPLPRVEFWVTQLEAGDWNTLIQKLSRYNLLFGERHLVNSERARWLSVVFLLSAHHAPALFQNFPSLVSLGPQSQPTRAYASAHCTDERVKS